MMTRRESGDDEEEFRFSGEKSIATLLRVRLGWDERRQGESSSARRLLATQSIRVDAFFFMADNQLFRDAISAALSYKRNPTDITDQIMNELDRT